MLKSPTSVTQHHYEDWAGFELSCCLPVGGLDPGKVRFPEVQIDKGTAREAPTG